MSLIYSLEELHFLDLTALHLVILCRKMYLSWLKIYVRRFVFKGLSSLVVQPTVALAMKVWLFILTETADYARSLNLRLILAAMVHGTMFYPQQIKRTNIHPLHHCMMFQNGNRYNIYCKTDIKC